MRQTRNSRATSRGDGLAVDNGTDSPETTLPRRVKSRTRDASDADGTPNDDDQDSPPPVKRRRVAATTSQAVQKKQLYDKLFTKRKVTEAEDEEESTCCTLPSRQHPTTYHRPLLLHPTIGTKGQDALLEWFDGVSEARAMPWRKTWIDPKNVDDEAELRTLLSRRAYEVWISEIMLQQTRVAVVIDYWNRWMARWPTLEDLAAAEPDDVLAAWKGLGYYSRATRIHEAAKLVAADESMRGLLPQSARRLRDEVPGVGPYTAGAISAIVFGQPEAMVDGNVLRVLSRQLGLLANAKTDKATIDLLWAAADAIVKDVSSSGEGDVEGEGDEREGGLSDRPGRWGQALMELGSTICTPKPNCSACPITSTCRAYQEGTQIASGKAKASPREQQDSTVVADIEDACQLCAPWEQANSQEEEQEVDEKKKDTDTAGAKQAAKGTKPKAPKQATLAAFAFTRKPQSSDGQQQVVKPGSTTATGSKSKQVVAEVVAEHARKFPLKVVKKPVREEETLVCAVRDGDGKYLLHRRPEKGLLAGLWELPSCPVKDPGKMTSAGAAAAAVARKKMARDYASGLMIGGSRPAYVADLGSVPWLFSHLKLTMHVHLFSVDGVDIEAEGGYPGSPSKWSDNVDEESMGTGMGKCWALVRDQES